VWIIVNILAEQARRGRCTGVSAQDCHSRRERAGWLQQVVTRSPIPCHGTYWRVWNGVRNEVLSLLLLLDSMSHFFYKEFAICDFECAISNHMQRLCNIQAGEKKTTVPV